MMTKQPVDYQKLFEASPLIRLVILQDKKEHFSVAKANKAAVDYFCQNNCKQIDGMRLDSFLDTTNTTHILQALTVCFESKVPLSIQVIPKITENIKVQLFLLNPVMDDNNEHVLYVDMQSRPPATEQDTVERERNDAISMFTTVFDISDVGFTVTDHHGRFVRVNDKFMDMTGWESIDLMGQELTILIPDEDKEKAWARHKVALDQEKKNFGEIRILRKNGSVMNVMVTSAMMELSNGRSFRITTVVDITDLKQIERDLRRAKDEADDANKAKSAFLANMSHELRTPLNAVIGFSEMMLNATLGPIENKHYLEYLGDIKFSAQHLLHIINDVLDMSKIEAGKMPLDLEDIDLAGLLESVRRLMITRAEKNNIKIILNVPNNLPKISLDERLIRQVLLNLLSNAVKFSHDGGEINIQLICDEGIKITVSDNGIGIHESRLKEIMEPFGQVNDPSLNKGQGTGLGLPIAKAMMEMHSGKLNVTSKECEGTTVTCTFPKERIVIKG